MIFHVRFDLLGLILLVLVLALIPLLMAVSGWLFQELRQSRRQLARRLVELPPVSPPSQSEEGYRLFISSVSHQTSNALQAILAALANLRNAVNERETLPQPELGSALAYLGQIEEQTRYLQSLMGNLRLLAQLDASEAPLAMQPLQPRTIVADVIMGSAARAMTQEIELRYQGPDRPPQIFANRELLTIALQNLVDNSLKYARAESREIVISLDVQPPHLLLRVADDGAGIPETALTHIFESAYRVPDPRTRRHVGSGLGLALVRRIVERHRGKVEAQSTYGEGTVITCVLPMDPSSAQD